MKSAARYTLYSQLALLGCVFLCVLIAPEIVFTANQGGVSNYGTQAATFGVFSLGVWVCVFFLIKASRLLEIGSLKLGVRLLAAGYVVLVMSTYPYKLNAVFENLHIVIALWFAIFQQCLAIWLVKLNSFDRTSLLCIGLQIVSLGIGILTVFEVVHMLFTAQIIGALGFGALVVHTTQKQYNN